MYFGYFIPTFLFEAKSGGAIWAAIFSIAGCVLGFVFGIDIDDAVHGKPEWHNSKWLISLCRGHIGRIIVPAVSAFSLILTEYRLGRNILPLGIFSFPILGFIYGAIIGRLCTVGRDVIIASLLAAAFTPFVGIYLEMSVFTQGDISCVLTAIVSGVFNLPTIAFGCVALGQRRKNNDA